jgi:corrinoid protein of di/trimethylamine methyltransferase
VQEKKKIIGRLSEAVLDRDPKSTELAAKEAVREGIDPLEAIEKGLISGITGVGDKYETGEFFLPDLVMGGEAFKAGIKILEPELLKLRIKRKSAGTIVLGTVAGDIHSLGKDIVATLLTAAGFEVHDLGVDVPVEKFIESVRALRPDILGISALMSTTIPMQRDIIKALEAEGLRDKVKVIIGGAATSELWRSEIEADDWAATAVEAVKKAKDLMRGE